MQKNIPNKSLSINMVTSVLSRIVVLITGLVVQHFILQAYGSTLNGLTSSITQVMSYLVLFEAGLGTASIQALYDPLSRNDWKKVSGIVVATGVEYKKITAAFSSVLLLVSLVLPFTLKGQVEFAVASLLTAVTGGSYIASYIVGGKYKAILSADRKMYVLYILDMLSSILSCVLRVMALSAGAGIVWVQLLHLGSILFKNAGYFIYVKIRYKRIDYKEVPDLQSISKRWSVLIHSIAGIVVNHTDVIILTLFASLKTVSVYSVYNMVFGQLSTTIQSTFIQAPQAHFGILYYKDKRKFEQSFRVYETVFTILLFWICGIALVMITPFVEVYTKGVTDIEYIDKWLPILFTLILLLNLLRSPAVMAVNVSGAFKETQKGAIIEAIINITVSLILFFATNLGLYGLLIGTVCSYIYRTTDLIYYTYKYIVGCNISDFIRTVIVNFALLGLMYYFSCVKFPVQTGSFIGWIAAAVIVAIVVSIELIVGNIIFNRERISEIYSVIKTKLTNN
ncbi:hypothetical protein [Ruthenibacterium lactatiformans]|uniref:hypothetical protein n=1 Tax=Ruthenibacterium lactatiformans TaxID=1550024 RepID=UPI001111B36C|nr:hypothetical protein [Ruthenibacterium lactatiformans]